MPKLSSRGRMWLKGFHVVFMGVWVGSVMSIAVLNLVAEPSNGHELYGVLLSLKFIDDFVLIPSAIGTLLTGFLISWLTPWGFFKWIWVTVKWVLTVATIIFGTFFMGPWLNEMVALAQTEPAQALQAPLVATNRNLLILTGGPMVAALLFMILISSLKPWKRLRRT